MLLTYTYVKGEEQLHKLLHKMGKDDNPCFMESFAHVDNITIERIEEKPNKEEGYRTYFILYMPHRDGTWHMSDARTKVHRDIRDGELNMKRV